MMIDQNTSINMSANDYWSVYMYRSNDIKNTWPIVKKDLFPYYAILHVENMMKLYGLSYDGSLSREQLYDKIITSQYLLKKLEGV